MTHRDGQPAQSPVAGSEVQGYAFDAKRRLPPILAQLGEAELAVRLDREAGERKARFNQAFWMEDRQWQVGTAASGLLAPAMFSGWGIRTLATNETSYNPMSYHNGSSWPYDTALCVLDLKRHGCAEEAGRVAASLLEAAAHFPHFRLPELFCGFAREEGALVDILAAREGTTAEVRSGRLEVAVG